jgi:thiol-disulfide isomerase/thioredoxin
MNYFDKYLKYKKKYNNIKNMSGGKNVLEELLNSEDLNFNAPILNSNKYNEDKNDLYDKYLDLDKSNNNIYVILFKANWCGHCNNFLPIWDQLQINHQPKDTIKFITYEHTVEDHLQIINNIKIDGFPTIIIYKNDTYTHYTDSRDIDTLTVFINS